MNKAQILFLEALRASLVGTSVNWAQDISNEEWAEIFQLAESHHVLPMIFEAVFNSQAARQMDPQLFLSYKKKTVHMVMMQTMKTNEFLRLYHELKEAGMTVCVVKGIICRMLYPKPDYRISGDEDLLIQPDQFELCHTIFEKLGMQPAEPNKDITSEYEVAYGKPGSPLYIELHKSLFPTTSEAYGEFGNYFDEALEHLIEVPIQEEYISTMDVTSHLFYLICHAFKHFLHSGFGIRQVCDIVLFANCYGGNIDWKRVMSNCKEIHADLFSAALFRIGEKYLVFDPEKANLPKEWQELNVNEEPMLLDLLNSGIYGDSSMSRKHSSNMTLSAVSAYKQGKQRTNGVINTLFPPAKALETRFPYLKKYPLLLPVAWGERILKYREETKRMANNDAAESIKIGNQRTELLKLYKIIK